MIKWQIHTFAEVGSTNDVIKDYCNKTGQYVVVRAERQTAGRGRRGRLWNSMDGNLFFSLALEISLQYFGQLVIAAALSLLQAIKALAPKADVQLKWPNDVLLGGAKVSGMLLEKGPNEYMIIGIGVNILQYPEVGMLYPTTSLKQEKINTTAADFMMLYLQYFEYNLQLMHNGQTALLRQQWLENAKGVGDMIKVLQEDQELCGIFKGIDENAHLLLEKDNKICQIRAGDVFYIEKEK